MGKIVVTGTLGMFDGSGVDELGRTHHGRFAASWNCCCVAALADGLEHSKGTMTRNP